jgi:hypothetical protein
MKKVLLPLLAFALISITLIIACQKNGNKKKDNSKDYLSTGKKLEITTNTQLSDNARLAPYCVGHGGPVGVGTSWDLATCKTKCEKGIGFRCGRETYSICGDGTTETISQSMGSCPDRFLTSAARKMDAILEFYDNGTAKIVFQKEVLAEERNNTTFEIEQYEYIDWPNYLLIGGRVYTSIRFVPQNYQINYSEGSHGSVTTYVEYIP